MVFLLIFPMLFGVTNADALNKFQEERDAGAEWNLEGRKTMDLLAKSIDVDGKIYYKLKWKE